MLRAALALALALGAGAAAAGWDSPTVVRMSDGSYRVQGSARSVLMDAFSKPHTVTPSGPTFTGSAPVVGPVGSMSATMSAQRTFNARAVAGAAARMAGGPAGVVMTAAAAAAWCKYSTGTFTCDPKVDPILINMNCIRIVQLPSLAGCAQTNPEAMAGGLSWLQANPPTDSFFGQTNTDNYTRFEDNCFLGTRTSRANDGSWQVQVPVKWCVQLSNLPSQVEKCPTIAETGQQGRRHPRDGKCETNAQMPVPLDGWLDRVVPELDTPEKVRGAGQEIITGRGDPSYTDSPTSLTGPRTVETIPTVTTLERPGEAPSQVIEQTRYTIDYSGDRYSVRETTTRTHSDGTRTIIDQPGPTLPPPGTTPAPGTGATPAPELKTCGLPDTPPCRIDESGTPPPPPADSMPDPEDALEPIKTVFENPQVADTSWSWSLQLPTGCSAFALPTLFGVTIPPIDVCQWQGVIHDLMSMLWIGVSIFFCAGMVFRTLST